MSHVIWAAGSACAVALTVLFAALIGWPSESKLVVPKTTGGGGTVQDISIEAVRRHVRRLSAVESRLTGYPGCERAFEYITSQLDGMGVGDRETQEFEVAVPMVREARLEAATPRGRASVAVHPLWPNLARTCKTGPEGVSGPLVDVGKGTDVELAGKVIRGSVVVMDWNSDAEWLSVPEFGGKAVIFKANDRATGYASRRKFLTVPADVPRFYVKKEDLPALEELLALENPVVTVRCDMEWKRAATRNILARVSGNDTPTDQPDADRAPIVFHAYYDSISVVPGLSPGAEQACGASTLLELGRYFAELPEKPPRPIYVLFTGGHGQALSGMIRFVRALTDRLEAAEEPAEGGPLIARMGKPGMFVGLDLSSHSERLGLFCLGHFRGQYAGQLKHKFSVLGLKLDEYVKGFAKGSASDEPGHFVDCINLTQGRGWWTYFPYRAPFESEIPTMAGLPAVTLGTIDDDRHRVDTPGDRFEDVEFGLLERQITTEPGKRAGLADIARALSCWKGPFTNSPLGNRFARLGGNVVWLDQDKDYVPNTPLSRATVFLKTGRRDKLLVGTRALPAAVAEADGRFEFDGLIKTSGNREFSNCLVEAYGVATDSFLEANAKAYDQYRDAVRPQGDSIGQGEAPVAAEIERDGSIMYAVDMARPGERPWQVKTDRTEPSVNPVCFPCRAITLFGLIDPRGYLTLKDVQMLDAATQSPPFQYGRSASDTAYGGAEENCWTLWAEPSLRVRLTLGLGFQEKRLILIKNQDTEDPAGEGFDLEHLRSIPSMVLQGAGDMQRLDQSRSDKLERHGVNNPRVRDIRAKASAHLGKAEKALASLDYKTYRAESEKGWALESKAYVELLSVTNNMIQGVLFYLALLLPFAYCLERLVFASATIRKRIMWMLVIFAASFTVLAVIHPAFRFTLTPFIVLYAFVVFALAAWVGLLVVGRFDAMLRARKQSVSGAHEDAGNTASIAVRAVDLGIANIRRRPQRGFLTGLTIVLLTFTLLSFTSIVPTVGISRLRHRSGNPAAYEGLLCRDRAWKALPEPLYDSMKRTFEQKDRDHAGVVAGRAWFFSDATGRLSQIDLALARRREGSGGTGGPESHGTGHFTAVSLLCMEHTEPAVTGIDRALVAGRWFAGPDDQGIILPEHVAKSLGCGSGDLGSDILVFGQRTPLIGIIGEKRLNEFEDLDGEPVTPVDFVRQEQMVSEGTSTEEEVLTLEEY
ncbi:MAG: M28 family peptidase, partial [Planctomycetota bacterium]